MKIGLIGNYGAANIGDNAILRAILNSHPDYDFTVFSSNPEKTYQELNINTAPVFPLGIRSAIKNGFRRSIKALSSVDAVILGGGGLMQDEYLYACFLWAWQIFWVKLMGKPLFIYATGVGPIKTGLGRFLTKYVYKYAVGVTVRDKSSYDTLHRLGLSMDNVEITADPAFLFKHVEQESARVPHTYVISLRPWLKYNGRIISVFTEYLQKLKAEKNAKFVFVCMQSIKEHDLKVITPVLKKVEGSIAVPKHFADLLHIMKEAEFAIGMRYHFLIAAMLTKTPALALSYSHKVDSLFKDTILEHYMLPLSGLNADDLEKKMTRLSVDYNNVKIYQKRRLEELKALAEKNIGFFEGFIKTLTAENKTDKISAQSGQE